MVRSREAVAYKEHVQSISRKAGLQTLREQVKVSMVLHPPLPQDWVKRSKRDKNYVLGLRRIDLDNAQKVALDALQGIAFENDRQVTDLSICLGCAIEGGGLTIEIEPDVAWWL